MASFLKSGRMHEMFTQPRHAARSSAAHRACRAATWTGGRSPLSSSVRRASRLAGLAVVAIFLPILLQGCSSLASPRTVPPEAFNAVFAYQVAHQIDSRKFLAVGISDYPERLSVSLPSPITRFVRDLWPGVFVNREWPGDSDEVMKNVNVIGVHRAPRTRLLEPRRRHRGGADRHRCELRYEKHYRYHLATHAGVWAIEKTEEINLESDCYGNVWLSCQ